MEGKLYLSCGSRTGEYSWRSRETWLMKINGVSEVVSVKSEGAIEHAFFT